MMMIMTTKTMIVILLLVIAVQCKKSMYDSLPMGSIESQHEFFVECQRDCISAVISNVELDPVDREDCKRQCTKRRDTALKDECITIRLSESLAICTSSACVFASRDLFPSEIKSFNSKHFLNLVAYCTKAGMDPHMVIPDFEDDYCLAAQLLTPVDGSRLTAFKNLAERLPEVSPAVDQRFQVDLIRSHPDVKIMFESVARVYLRTSHNFDVVSEKFLSSTRDNFKSYSSFSVDFDHNLHVPVYTNPELVWYPSSDGDNVPESEPLTVGYVADLASEFVRGFGLLIDMGHSFTESKRPDECHIELVSNQDGTMSWLLSRGSQFRKSGYELELQTTFFIAPPTLIYSQEYLTDLCRKIKPDNLSKAISMDIEGYYYDFGLTRLPSYFPLVKIYPTQKTAARFDFSF